jgi:hypothetical protein
MKKKKKKKKKTKKKNDSLRGIYSPKYGGDGVRKDDEVRDRNIREGSREERGTIIASHAL